LQSPNPVDRLRGIEMINSHEGFHSRKLAYNVALQVYPDETEEDVRAGLMTLILAFGKGDPKAFEYFQRAANESRADLAYMGSKGLLSYPQGLDEGLARLRYAFDAGHWFLQLRIIGDIAKLGKNSWSILDIVTKNLNSKSRSLRHASDKAVKTLKKSDVDVVQYLMNQLESGTNEDKVAACAGLGALGQDAKKSAIALGEALRNPSVIVREKAAWALLQMEKGAAAAETELKEALKDESPAVSRYALKALSKFSKITKEQKEQIKQMEDHQREIKEVQKAFGLKDKEVPKETEEQKAPKFGMPTPAEGISVPADDETALMTSLATPPTAAESDYKNKFFMSHSSKDFEWVEKVAREIDSWPGCRAWMCERDIYHGQDWLEAIYDGIDACNWFILFWSQNAENSQWTMDEIRQAKMRNVESGDTHPRVSIVNLGMPEMPRLLARHQGSKVIKDEDVAEFCNRLRPQIEF